MNPQRRTALVSVTAAGALVALKLVMQMHPFRLAELRRTCVPRLSLAHMSASPTRERWRAAHSIRVLHTLVHFERLLEMSRRMVELLHHCRKHADVARDRASHSLRNVNSVARLPRNEQPVEDGSGIGVADERGCLCEMAHAIQLFEIEGQRCAIVPCEILELSPDGAASGGGEIRTLGRISDVLEALNILQPMAAAASKLLTEIER
jgi:hypothetical protein